MTKTIICQKDGGKKHLVAFNETGQAMLAVAKNYDDGADFYGRLHIIPNAQDAVANDVKCHLRCWVDAKRKASAKDKSIQSQEIDNTNQVIADIEIINILKLELSDPSHQVINSNHIESMYIKLLKDNRMAEENMNKSYKKYFKRI